MLRLIGQPQVLLGKVSVRVADVKLSVGKIAIFPESEWKTAKWKRGNSLNTTQDAILVK